jgi:hypothetical protein
MKLLFSVDYVLIEEANPYFSISLVLPDLILADTPLLLR